MTLNLAAIFGAEPVAIVPVAVAPEATDLDADVHAVAFPAPWPIVEGEEHFSIWIDEDCQQWPEFIPGHHYDFRQPSKLQGLCSTKG